MSFHDLGLSKGLIDALTSKNYSKPTPIQREAIPLVLTGRDLLGIAQTGTGKTAAFMLPAIDRLLASARGRPMPGTARMLILAPTRELAAQIAEAARAYASTSRISVGVIFGGIPVSKSIREVSRGLDVLVATPGRLLDVIDQRRLDLSNLEILVLDEADQMLDLGFIHALKAIVRLDPGQSPNAFLFGDDADKHSPARRCLSYKSFPGCGCARRNDRRARETERPLREPAWRSKLF